jgi:hypothetical protein
MEFKELIAAFAAKHGIGGLDGASGAVALDCDGVVVELLEDPHSHSIIVCAEIGHPPPDSNGVFGSMMLQANFLLRGTDGATLCQNPESGAYALVRPFPLALTDGASLAAGVESLVNQTENWRRVIAGMHTAETVRSKEDESGDSHHDMISNGYFHV